MTNGDELNPPVSAYLGTNMLAPPGGLARHGAMSTVTTCDEYPQPFVVLVVMVLILMCFPYKTWFLQVDCISCFQMQLIIECFGFFRQIWRKKQQSLVIYSVSI